MTKIEWTKKTWNPIVGCSVISPGCTNCYAMRQARRLGANDKTPQYEGTTEMTRGGPVWTGKVAMASDALLTAPLRRRKPTMYFVNSMGDLFHEDVPDEWIDRVFAVMALSPQHTFQILTKRAERMRGYMKHTFAPDNDWLASAVCPEFAHWNDMPEVSAWPPKNIWLGVSAEDQARADERIPHLLATPAAVRFVSAEPLLGPVNLRRLTSPGGQLRPYCANVDALDGTCQSLGDVFYNWFALPTRLDWVIVGGESGPGARPMSPDWARSLRDQCQQAGVPFFMKQMDKKQPIPADLLIRQFPAPAQEATDG